MTGGQAGEPDITDRVVRGFEAMVESEQAAAARVPPSVPGPTPASPPPASPLSDDGQAGRLAALEEQVRQTMDELSELVQAEIPEAVDSLRDELGAMRIDVQTSLHQATGDFAQERQELRAQIAKTVGAANKWFVKARDQLLERLDELKAVAAETESKARQAAEAATAASAAASAAASQAATAATRPPAPAVELVKPEVVEDDSVFEWDVEGEEPPPSKAAKAATKRPAKPEAGESPAARVELAIDSPELDSLMEPVRGDIRELQGEISAMGHAVAQLRADVLAVGKRLPARPKPVRLDERDIDVIVEAVILALTPPRPAKKAAAKRTIR